jgi:hypothetical protein
LALPDAEPPSQAAGKSSGERVCTTPVVRRCCGKALPQNRNWIVGLYARNSRIKIGKLMFKKLAGKM